MTLSPEALVSIGAPVASGATALQARAKRRSDASSWPPRGRSLDAGAAVLGIQCGDRLAVRRFGEVVGWA